MVQSLHEFLEENINYLKENGLYNEIDTIEGAKRTRNQNQWEIIH